MAANERFDRSQLKEPDSFFEGVGAARRYVEENRGQVLGIAGAILGAIALVAGSTAWYASSRNAAASEFARAVSNLEFDSPTAAEANLEKLEGLSNSGAYGPLGDLYQANLALEAGRSEESIAVYERFLEATSEPVLRQVALMGKAHALETTGKQTEALAALELATGIEGPYRKAALADRARLAQATGDEETAKKSLQELLELQGVGGDAAAIERRLAALGIQTPPAAAE